MSLLNNLIGPVTGLLDKFIEDKDQKNRLAFELSTLAEKHHQELMRGQLEINKVEAAHKSLFVAGWRPACGWVSVFGLFYATIISNILGIWYEVPEIDTNLLTTILMGMLGLGAMRSFEKTKAVSREK